MLSPDEAWKVIAAQLAPLPEESLARRAAAGRVLARALPARVDVPAADVSAMDGFAVAGAVPPGESRPVAATLAAGVPPGYRLQPPSVARIMTGAPLPDGADRVIPVELAVVSGDAAIGDEQSVTFQESGKAGDHVRRRGEVLRAGDPLLPAGAPATPGALALFATHGYAELPVHRAPRVAVLATGDEVVPPEREPAPGQLRDSHTDFLLAAGRSLGLAFEPLGIAPDRAAALRPLVERGLSADVLLLCGGVSMGEFDLVEGVLADLGCRALFDGVAIQPGKPLVFAVHERAGRDHAGPGLVFGLPGNPGSVMVAFWLFVRPALKRLLGFADGWWQGALPGELAAALPAAGRRDRFLAATLELRAGAMPLVTPHPPKGSHDLAAYAHGAGLVRVREGSEPRPAGDPCEYLPLGG